MAENKKAKQNAKQIPAANPPKAKGRMPKAKSDMLKPVAQQLYFLGKTLKEISALIQVDEKHIGKWANTEGWAAHRAVITTSKPQLLKSLYGQCKEITDAIDKRPEGERYSNSKEADSILKLTAAIKNLEGEANISQVVEVGIAIGEYVSTYKPEHTELVVSVFNDFLNHRLQNVAK